MDAPLFPQALVGFRIWNVAGRGDTKPELVALAKQERWQPQENTAQCHRGGHPVPAEHCHCGFYAFYSLWRARVKTLFNPGSVVGAVLSSGSTQCHYSGYRAEKAQVIALLDNGHSSCQDLAKHYQVPLFKSAKHMKTYVSELGGSVPKDLRPSRPRWYRNHDFAATLGLLAVLLFILNMFFSVTCVVIGNKSPSVEMTEVMGPMLEILLMAVAAMIFMVDD